MTILLGDIYKDEIISKGGVSVDTEFTGELSGSIADGLKLESLRGTIVNDDSVKEYEGYLKLGGVLKPKPLVWNTLNTTGGNVRGNFDEGLNLKSIYGSGLVEGQTFSNDGEGISYRGGELYVTQLNPHRELYLTSGEINAQHRDVISVDCTLNTTIALMESPSTGDFVRINVVGGDPENHPVTVGASHDIEGDSPLFQLDRAVSIQITYNGTKWRVTR